jgi:hypothetical protein
VGARSGAGAGAAAERLHPAARIKSSELAATRARDLIEIILV